MSAQPFTFPAYIALRYQRDGQTEAQLLADTASMLGKARRQLTNFADEAQANLNRAISLPRNEIGALDLNIPQLRAAAAAQDARAIAAREVATATLAAARAEGIVSQEMRQTISAAKALATSEEQLAASMAAQLRVAQQVQAQLDQVGTSGTALAIQMGRGANAQHAFAGSMRANSQATAMFGQQLQDVIVQAQMGTSAFTIFAQQVPQAAFALSGVTGAAGTTAARVGALARFMTGPWGLAITGATVVLGPLIAKLLESGEAADMATFASNKFSEAQGILGSVIDLTTGRINTQSEALLALARAQAVAGQIEARRSQAEANSSLDRITEYQLEIGGGFGGGLSVGRSRSEAADIIEAFRDGSLSLTEANRGLESMLETGTLIESEYLDAAQALTQFGVAAENLRAFQQAERALDGDRGALAGFLNRSNTARPRSSNAGSTARALQEFGERTAEDIQRINERFDDTPRLIDQAAQATRELDRIIADLSERKPANFEQMIASAEAAKATVQDALVRPMRELEQSTARRLQIDQLSLAGRDAEATALQEIWRQESLLGPLTEERKQAILGIAQFERDITEEIQRRRDEQEAYLQTTRQLRGELESLFAGDGFNPREIARQLQARLSVEAIFGDALRDIETATRRSYDSNIDFLSNQAERGGDALREFANVVGNVTQAIRDPEYAATLQRFDATMPGAAGTSDPNTIVVTAPPRKDGTVSTMTPEAYFDLVGRRMVEPLITGIEDALGTRLGGQLGEVLGSSVSGYLRAGPLGAGLGALQGLLPTSGVVKGANNGLGTGQMLGGLMSSLGIGSNSGAQIGGAIGGALPIPGGDIIGSIAGGVLGKMLKSTPYGTASFNGGTGFNVTAKGKGRADGANDLGNSFQDALDAIAERLDAQLGEFAVSIGTLKDSFVISTSGKSGKLKKGADIQTFASAAEAQTAALMDAIADGAIKGITAGEQSYLAQAKDLEKALADVLDFRSVFDRLKAYRDPVGAALDELDDQFSRLRRLFGDLGASAGEYAQLEELYGIERAQAIKDATEQLTGSLRDLLDELTIGDSGLSLRDRRANALTEYTALMGRVQSGDMTASDEFAASAKALLDIERQIFGSQSGYFSRFFEVKGITEGALSEQERLTNAAINRDSPLSGGGNTGAASLVTAIDRSASGNNLRLDTINDNIVRLANVMATRTVGNGGGRSRLEPAFVNNF